MAGEDLVAKVKTDLQFLQDRLWEGRIMGVLLYGSHARGEASLRSDIDLCVVAPEVSDSDRAALWREFISHIRDDRYDVRIFELLPLHIKMAVIEEGIVVHSKDTPGALRALLPLPARMGRPEAQADGQPGRDDIHDKCAEAR